MRFKGQLGGFGGAGNFGLFLCFGLLFFFFTFVANLILCFGGIKQNIILITEHK